MIIQSRLNLTKEGGFPPKAKPHINFKQQPRVHPKVSCLSSYLNVLIGFIGVELRSPKFNDFHPLWREEMEEFPLYKLMNWSFNFPNISSLSGPLFCFEYFSVAGIYVDESGYLQKLMPHYDTILIVLSPTSTMTQRIQSGQTRGSIQGVTQRPRDTYWPQLLIAAGVQSVLCEYNALLYCMYLTITATQRQIGTAPPDVLSAINLHKRRKSTAQSNLLAWNIYMRRKGIIATEWMDGLLSHYCGRSLFS